jgi:hypothetical protein
VPPDKVAVGGKLGWEESTGRCFQGRVCQKYEHTLLANDKWRRSLKATRPCMETHTRRFQCATEHAATPQEIMKISWKVLQNVLQLSPEFDETITLPE